MVTGILWITHDLTKEPALNRNQGETSEILDALKDSCVKLDDQLRFVYVNPKAEDFFGNPKEEMIGKVVWEVFPETIGSDILKAVSEAGEVGERISAKFFSSVRKRWIYLTASPASDGSILITFSDIH